MRDEIKKKIAEQSNRSPEPLRSYIHSLETSSPTDLVLENAQLKFEQELFFAAARILAEEIKEKGTSNVL